MATKTKNDPAEAIVTAINELQEQIKPANDQISEIKVNLAKAISDLEATAKAEIDQVESSIAETQEEISRLEQAAAALRGELPKVTRSSGKRASRGSVPNVNASQDQLRKVLEDAGENLSSTQIRGALGIAQDVPANKVTKFLKDAIESGVIVQHGERRGAKYGLA